MPDLLTSVVEGSRAVVLERIAEKQVALAIWNRRAPTGLARWLDGLPADRLPRGRFAARPGDVPAHMEGLCEVAGLKAEPGRDALIDDIAKLAARFSQVAGSESVNVKLEALDNDSCWRFHRDHVGFRLNATYRGPGTQWPPLDHAARAQRAQRRYCGRLNEMPRFAVGLFKGVRRAGAAAVLHRSPPIAGTAVTRLFLCLNEDRDGD